MGISEDMLDELMRESIGKAGSIITGSDQSMSDDQRKWFTDGKTHAAMKKVLHEALENGQKPQQRTVTFVAGPYGSKNMLITASENPGDREVPKAVAEASANAAFFNFTKAKDTLSAELQTDVNANYDAIWRPLVSGMDRTVGTYTRDVGMNLMVDNSLAANGGSKEHMLNRLKEEREAHGGSKVQVFAVALTPEESVAITAPLNIKQEQAITSAKDFAAGFEELKKHVSDITLVDKDMNPIYVQRDGVAVGNTPEMAMKVAKWKEASGVETAATPSVPLKNDGMEKGMWRY